MHARGRTHTAGRVAGGVLAVLLALPLAAGCSSSTPVAGSGVPGGAGSASAAGPSSGAPASSPGASSPATPSAGASSTAKTGTERLADGSTRVTDAAVGYQITLPKGYTRITSKAQLEEIIKAGSKLLQNQAAQLGAAAFAQNVKLYALNRLTGSSINLVANPAGGMTSDDLPSQAAQIKQLLVGQLHLAGATTTTIKIDGATGLRADGTLTVEKNKIKMTQLYAVHNDSVYVITLSSLDALPEATVTAVLASTHFLG